MVFSSLPGPAQVRAVVEGPDGLLAALRPGLVHVDLSTSSSRRGAVAVRGRSHSGGDADRRAGLGWRARRRAGHARGDGERRPRRVRRGPPAIRRVRGERLLPGGVRARHGRQAREQPDLPRRRARRAGGLRARREGGPRRARAAADREPELGRTLRELAPLFFGRNFEMALFKLGIAEKDVALVLESARQLGQSFRFPKPPGKPIAAPSTRAAPTRCSSPRSRRSSARRASRWRSSAEVGKRSVCPPYSVMRRRPSARRRRDRRAATPPRAGSACTARRRAAGASRRA